MESLKSEVCFFKDSDFEQGNKALEFFQKLSELLACNGDEEIQSFVHDQVQRFLRSKWGHDTDSLKAGLIKIVKKKELSENIRAFFLGVVMEGVVMEYVGGVHAFQPACADFSSIEGSENLKRLKGVMGLVVQQTEKYLPQNNDARLWAYRSAYCCLFEGNREVNFAPEYADRACKADRKLVERVVEKLDGMGGYPGKAVAKFIRDRIVQLEERK